jgi:hypothetical protein
MRESVLKTRMIRIRKISELAPNPAKYLYWIRDSAIRVLWTRVLDMPPVRILMVYPIIILSFLGRSSVFKYISQSCPGARCSAD